MPKNGIAETDSVFCTPYHLLRVQHDVEPLAVKSRAMRAVPLSNDRTSSFMVFDIGSVTPYKVAECPMGQPNMTMSKSKMVYCHTHSHKCVFILTKSNDKYHNKPSFSLSILSTSLPSSYCSLHPSRGEKHTYPGGPTSLMLLWHFLLA